MPDPQSTDRASFRSSFIIEYNDIYFRVIACLLAAHILVAYGETLTLFEMLLMPHYYYALIPSFLIAFILFNIIRAINIRLDKKFDWTAQTIQRAGTQVFFAFIIPAVCAFLMASLYFAIRGLNIFKTTYLKYDFQFILLQLLLINVYYIAYHFYLKWSQAEKIISQLAVQHVGPNRPKETFTVSKGAANLLLAINEIAYFFREGDNNYLRTVNGEDYFVNTALDEVQQQLPEDIFFRANRQLIVHREACKAYGLLTYGKLSIKLHPPLATDAVVSQKRAKDFKSWMDYL
ncbi:LytTR family transcriptional regulator [Pedobacter sp. ISL-68]|uniref:LytTR family DNA-binding domain-containing protein n=1 Tax=unclassified Pedobacter TaxID=2628915 RepID=UPI001BEAC579|nr:MULTISPECIES: LytTR family DNA-binding domain-containing protein [unclassified Pedobacter]MBT2561321.1 LytTR family transcriptional regulator [Pedobacter sp. ISL-64]MBT2590710.1 LytTR family transcriptional regulator [Pedobacter sp. ISL-68]